MNELALANFQSAMSCAPLAGLREEALRKFRYAARAWSNQDVLSPEEEGLNRTAHRMIVRLFCEGRAAKGSRTSSA